MDSRSGRAISRADDIEAVLSGGDRRSIGRADEVVAELGRCPDRFAELWACLRHRDPLVRMRAADVLEKLSRSDPTPFSAHKDALLAGTFDDGTAEVRWHLIPIASRLSLTTAEARRFYRTLDRCLRNDPSRIVKVAALQAACDVLASHPDMQEDFGRMRSFAQSSGWPSLTARAARLLRARSSA